MAANTTAVLPGEPNPSRNAVSCEIYGTYNLVAYAAQNNVIILSWDLHVLQVLGGFKQPVTSVRWSEKGGKLAASAGTIIAIFEPTETFGSWRRTCTIESDFVPEVLAWDSAGNRLVTCGDYVAMWELQLQKVVIPNEERHRYGSRRVPEVFKVVPLRLWQTRTTTHVTIAAFSPDDEFFATAGEHDRVVKVWHRIDPSPSTPWSFLYLPHPRAVLSLKWRRESTTNASSCSEYSQNILLTTCRDNVVRLWLQTGLANGSPQFSVCNVIEPHCQCAIGWLDYRALLRCATPSQPNNAATPAADFGDTRDQDIFSRPYRYDPVPLKRTESHDWIVGVQDNGMCTIWRVRAVVEQPRQAPSVSLWLNFKIDSLEGSRRPARMYTFCRQYATDEARSPTKISLYTSDAQTGLSHWSISMSRSAGPGKVIALRDGRCYGHRCPVTRMTAHPSLSLFATTDTAARTIVWHTPNQNLLEHTQSFEVAFAINGVQLVEWAPLAPAPARGENTNPVVFFVLTPTDGIAVHVVDSKSPAGHVRIGVLDGSAKQAPMMSLHAVLKAPKQGTNTANQWWVVAIATSGDTVTLWDVRVTPPSLSSPQATVASRLVSTRPLPDGVGRVACSTSCHGNHCRGFVGKKRGTVYPLPPWTVATGGIDGTVRLWRVREVGTATAVLEEASSFTALAERSPIERLESSYWGRFAVYSPAKPDHVLIWQVESAPPQFTLEATLDVSRAKRDPKQSTDGDTAAHEHEDETVDDDDSAQAGCRFDWLSVGDGRDVLAVTRGNELRTFTPRIGGGFDTAWQVLAELSRRLSNRSHDVRWARGGHLVIGKSNRLLVLKKWSGMPAPTLPQPSAASVSAGADTVSTDPEPAEPDTAVLEPPAFATVFQRVAEGHGSPPPYHPLVVMEYLLEGDFDSAGRIFAHLAAAIGESEGSVHVPPMDWRPLIDPAASGNAASTSTAKSQAAPEPQPPPSEPRPRSIFDMDEWAPMPAVKPSTTSTAATTRRGKVFSVSCTTFTAQAARELSEKLTRVRLGGVDPAAQLRLLAILDTFAQMQDMGGALDECGARFLVAYKVFAYMRRTQPPAVRPERLTSADYAWVLHSEAQETLLPQVLPADADWPAARALGVGYWLRNLTTLRTLTERIAKVQFTAKKQPLDSALLYLAQGKKSILIGLFKAVKDATLATFFSNNFAEERWQTAALKNAYNQMGKQQFEKAAIFFLLAGKLRDCADIILKNMKDPQLALVVSRLVEGGDGGDVYKWVLRDHVIPLARTSGDTWLESIALWLLKDHHQSLAALLPSRSVDRGGAAFNPAVLHFHRFLANHTLLRNAAESVKDDTELVQRAAAVYCAVGCNHLALALLKSLRVGLKAKPIAAAAVAKTTADVTEAVAAELEFRAVLQLTAQQCMALSADAAVLPALAADYDHRLVDMSTDLRALCHDVGLSWKHVSGAILQLSRHLQTLRLEYGFTVRSDTRVSLMSTVADQIVALPVQWIAHPLSRKGAAQLLSVAIDLHHCLLAHLEKNSPISPSEREHIASAVRAGVFFAAWGLFRFDALTQFAETAGGATGDGLAGLFRLLATAEKFDESDVEVSFSGTPRGPPRAALELRRLRHGPMLTWRSSTANREEDEEALLQCVLLLVTTAHFVSALTVSAAPPPPIASGLKQLTTHIVRYLRHVPPLAVRTAVGIGSANPQAAVGDSLKKSKLWRIPSVRSLWDAVATHPAATNVFAKHLSKIRDGRPMAVMNTAAATDVPTVRFSRDFLSIRDKDILQSFSVGPNGDFAAVASTVGIKEFRFSSLAPGEVPGEKTLLSANTGLRSDVIANWLEPHPNFPYYMSGSVDGSVILWQYGVPGKLVAYRTGPGPRICRVRFNPSGTKFGACDMEGTLSLWRFEASEETLRPFAVMRCHAKRTSDFTFLNNGSFLATVGLSHETESNGGGGTTPRSTLSNENLCLWDVLLPPSKSLVASYQCHDGGANSLVYSPRYQQLITGGKKGEILVYDLRQRRLLEALKTHTATVKSLAVDPYERVLVSGSNDGHIKVFSLPTLREQEVWQDAHQRHTFVRPTGAAFLSSVSRFGVMEVRFFEHSAGIFLYSCGADGRMLQRAVEM